MYTPITFVLLFCTLFLLRYKHCIYVAHLPPAEKITVEVSSLFLPNSVKNDISELISGVGVSQICHGMVVGGREEIVKDR